MNCKQCNKCGAKWIDGQLYWATGAKGKDEDLAGLVCNKLGDNQCINPARGDESGDSWAAREKYSAAMDSEFDVDPPADPKTE